MLHRTASQLPQPYLDTTGAAAGKDPQQTSFTKDKCLCAQNRLRR